MNKYNELLNFMLQTLKEGKGLVVDNMPQLARDIVLNETIRSSIYFIIFGILFVLTFILLIRVIKIIRDSDDNDGDNALFFMVFIPLMILGILTVVNMQNIIKAQVTPSLVVVEKIKDMIK